MQCGNNIKQWLIALHNYHDTKLEMPDATARLEVTSMRTGWNGTHGSSYWSPTVLLFPFMEQQTRWDDILSGPQGIANGWMDEDWACLCVWEGNNAPLQRQVSTLLCPSGIRAVMDGDPTQTNYMHSYGDSVRPNTFHNRPCNLRGLFAPADPGNTRTLGRTFAFIQDGTSRTIAIAEAVIAPGYGNAGYNDVKGHMIGLFMDWEDVADGSGNGNKGPGEICSFALVTMPNDRRKYNTANRWAGVYYGNGLRVADGRLPYTGFTTVLPPNSPSCAAGWENDNNWEIQNGGWGVKSPSSNHPGGVNVGFADGSGHFITDTINAGSSTAFPVASGRSPYGTWGALGSPDGGESVNF
jgi:prepilin-type processing-associated H-X9-DG protein